MLVEVKDLMDHNNMLSHLFFECVPKETLIKIKEKYIGKKGEEKDWQVESVKIPVNLTIGGYKVNPKAFFDAFRNQIVDMINKEAVKLVSEKMGSEKIRDIQNSLNSFTSILEDWEEQINWVVPNPFLEDTKEN